MIKLINYTIKFHKKQTQIKMLLTMNAISLTNEKCLAAVD